MPTLLIIALLLSGMIYLQHLTQRGMVVYFPFLFMSIWFIWLFPQLYALGIDGTVAEHDLDRTITMFILVMLCVYVGWWTFSGPNPVPAHEEPDNLVFKSWVMCAIGATASIAIRFMPEEQRAVSQWTGPLTILVFFTQPAYLALALGWYIFLRHKNKQGLLIIAVVIMAFAPQIFIGFRRASIGQMILISISMIWFCSGKVPPRTVIIVGTILSALLINNVSALRHRSYSFADGKVIENKLTLSDFTSIDWTEGILTPSAFEARNAVMYMEFIDRSNYFDFGASLWDAFVWAFIPGQIIGFETKRSLMIGGFNQERLAAELGYKGQAGATFTGLADSFQMFWYFGSALFFAMGAMLAKLYQRAIKGGLHSMVLYSCLLVPGMEALTHFASHFWVETFTFYIFMAFVLKKSRPNVAPESRQVIPASR